MGAPTVRWRVPAARWVAAVPLLARLAACEQGPSREAVILLDSAGVTIVDNDYQQPAWAIDARWRLSPRPRIQVGNQPTNPDQMLYRAAHTRRTSNGGIAVANRGLGDVKVFDEGGFHV